MPLKWHRPPFEPRELKIELTQKCPLNCIHCSSSATPSSELTLPFNRITSLLKEAKKLGVKELVLSGGEPLLLSWLPDVLKLSRNLDLQATLFTTGIATLSMEEVTPEWWQALFKDGLTKVVFSIHGGSAEVHERVTRVAGSFDKTMNAIKSCSRARLDAELHFVPLNMNYRELPSVAALASSLGLKQLSLLRFVPHGRGTLIATRYSLDRSDHVTLRRMVKRCRSTCGITIRLGSPFNILWLSEDVECWAAIRTLTVGPTGRIYPCDAFKNIEPQEVDAKGDFNSVLDHGLADVWERSSYLATVREYLTGDFSEPCRSCTKLEQCKSGCLAQKVLVNRCFAKDKDPDCILKPGSYPC